MELMMKTIISLAVIAMVFKLGMAVNYTVGAPNGGWDPNTNLQSWVSSQTFLAGDNLIFQYGATHSVLEVSKADHDSCQTSNSIQTYSNGNTLVPLSSPGKRYFICGTLGHCNQGMKLEINILATSTPPAASPTAPPPTTSPSPINPPSPPTSPVTPPVSSPNTKSSAPKISPSSPPESTSLSPTTATSPSPDVISLPAPPPSSANKNTFAIGFGLVLMVLWAI